MQISNYTGTVIAGRGPGKSENTILLENALRTVAETGVPQRIHIDDGEARDRIKYRLRNLATQNKVSCSLGTPEDNPNDLVIIRATPKDGSPMAPTPQKKVGTNSRATAPPQKRQSRSK